MQETLMGDSDPDQLGALIAVARKLEDAEREIERLKAKIENPNPPKYQLWLVTVFAPNKQEPSIAEVVTEAREAVDIILDYVDNEPLATAKITALGNDL